MGTERLALFFRSLEKNYELSTEVKLILSHELKSECYVKGDIIVEQGARVYDIIFLIKGVVLSSFIRDGKEFTTNISMEGEIIAIPMRDSSTATLMALEDTTILKIRLSRFEQLMEEHAEFAIMGYKMFKHLLRLVAEEYFDFTGLEAKDAYQKVLEDRPELFRRVPLKHIAANLGITPSSLSRIRSGKEDM